jgi:protein-S-isoprenylcysteine O-methyltransferase Ste14
MSRIETGEHSPKRIRTKRAVSVIATIGLLFIPAGRVDWTEAWVFLGVSSLFSIIFKRYLMRKDPELVGRRSQIQPGTKGWDKVWLGFYIATYAALLVVAGLDAGRYHWSHVPVWGNAVGTAVYLFSLLLIAWAMSTNTHFEGTVRIQDDRDHRVVEEGPYRYVRHPGYVAIIAMGLALPAMLGSCYAYIPAFLLLVLYVLRTVLEDRTLLNELDGYRQYAARVRFRLVPGAW